MLVLIWRLGKVMVNGAESETWGRDKSSVLSWGLREEMDS